MPQHVTVTDYDPRWPQKYEEEKEKIRHILGEDLVAIYHIGSTSVPGLAAKPIIDIMAAVKSLDRTDQKAGKFIQIGYEYLGEFGIAGRRYLRKGGDERTHQIHIFQADDLDNIVRHLAFRDYMRTHKKEREEYASLKKELALRFPYDIGGYCDGKEDFVRRAEAEALSCYDADWDRLYLAAGSVRQERTISPLIEAGSVAAALMTEGDLVYVGVCIDTACSLGMCAERNAIANMITNGGTRVKKIAAVAAEGKMVMPCGACRELLRQLGEGAEDMEILTDYERKRTVRLKELLPGWRA